MFAGLVTDHTSFQYDFLVQKLGHLLIIRNYAHYSSHAKCILQGLSSVHTAVHRQNAVTTYSIWSKLKSVDLYCDSQVCFKLPI